jgi:Mg/Co/Ni transporter MgtE
MQITVQQVMTPCPAAIFEGSTIDEALDRLLAQNASEIYVTDAAGCLLGVVPDYELLKVQLAQTGGVAPISSLMSRSLLTTEPRRAVAALAPAFRESFCRKAAVVEAGLLVGQIDRRDVLRALRHAAGLSPCDDVSRTASTGADCGAPPAIRGPRFLQNAPCTADCGDESEF